MYLTLSASPWNEIQPTCEVMRLELDIIFAIEECSPSTTAAGNGKNCRDLPCSEAGFDALAPGRRLATATADGAKCQRNPKNQQQYPIWRAREGNLSLMRAEETGYIQDAGACCPGGSSLEGMALR